eukprot:7379891-Prymnesium_polylepis.1
MAHLDCITKGLPACPPIAPTTDARGTVATRLMRGLGVCRNPSCACAGTEQKANCVRACPPIMILRRSAVDRRATTP